MCISDPKVATPQIEKEPPTLRTKQPGDAVGVNKTAATKTKLTGARGLRPDLFGALLPDSEAGTTQLGA